MSSPSPVPGGGHSSSSSSSQNLQPTYEVILAHKVLAHHLGVTNQPADLDQRVANLTDSAVANLRPAGILMRLWNTLMAIGGFILRTCLLGGIIHLFNDRKALQSALLYSQDQIALQAVEHQKALQNLQTTLGNKQTALATAYSRIQDLKNQETKTAPPTDTSSLKAQLAGQRQEITELRAALAQAQNTKESGNNDSSEGNVTPPPRASTPSNVKSPEEEAASDSDGGYDDGDGDGSVNIDSRPTSARGDTSNGGGGTPLRSSAEAFDPQGSFKLVNTSPLDHTKTSPDPLFNSPDVIATIPAPQPPPSAENAGTDNQVEIEGKEKAS